MEDDVIKPRIAPSLVLFVCLLLSIGILLISVGIVPVTSASPSNPYDPSLHGIPATLAGYKVLAVFTPETTACMPEGFKRLVLQTQQPSMNNYLNESQPETIEDALKENGISDITQWDIQIVGPGFSLNQIIAANESWNEAFTNGECIRSEPIQVEQIQEGHE